MTSISWRSASTMARRILRPMRPNPLMATRTDIFRSPVFKSHALIYAGHPAFSRNLFNSLGRRHKRPGNPESGAGTRGVEFDPIAEKRLDEGRRIIPGTGADHPFAAVAGDPGRSIGRRAIEIVVPAILDPLEHVARHVVKAEAIGRERAHRRGLAAVPGAAAVFAIGVILAEFVAPGIERLRSRPRGIFVFCFTEEP